ncbi:MAG: hypothetical protein E7523_05050 [Ruminococcaceae bacterium]|nr:hypothetical protein [Oscillospiraceae bacterium]
MNKITQSVVSHVVTDNQSRRKKEKQTNLQFRIAVTAKYSAQVEWLQNEAQLQKCRSWFAPASVVGDTVLLHFTWDRVYLSYQKDSVQMELDCAYDGIQAVVEMKEGILLHLSKKRFLFLPVTQSPEDNKMLMDILILLAQKCRNTVKNARLQGKGITAKMRIALIVRKYKLLHPSRLALLAPVLLSFVLLLAFALPLLTDSVADKSESIRFVILFGIYVAAVIIYLFVCVFTRKFGSDPSSWKFDYLSYRRRKRK